MDEAARTEAMDVVTRLAAAYYAGRDSANYATNIREEARDQLLAAMAAMRVRKLEAGPYRIIRNLDRSRTLNLQKLEKLLGDKADKLATCYESSPRQSIQVFHDRAGELEQAARTVGKKQVVA
jgi:hypothetical protein